jgi:hypothetical protein
MVATNVLSENVLNLTQACALLPAGRGTARTHPATLTRWILKGVRGPAGKRVRLEATRIGGRWITSREALERFARALTPNFECSPAFRPGTAAQQKRAAERAGVMLQKIGI